MRIFQGQKWATFHYLGDICNENYGGIIIGFPSTMKKSRTKIRDLILLIGVLVAIFAGIYSAYHSLEKEPVTEPAQQESKISNETTGSLVTGILALVFKNGLELVQVMRESN